jgi:hypothetical protein
MVNEAPGFNQTLLVASGCSSRILASDGPESVPLNCEPEVQFGGRACPDTSAMSTANSPPRPVEPLAFVSVRPASGRVPTR